MNGNKCPDCGRPMRYETSPVDGQGPFLICGDCGRTYLLYWSPTIMEPGLDMDISYSDGTLYVRHGPQENETTIPLPPGLRAEIVRDELDNYLATLEEA